MKVFSIIRTQNNRPTTYGLFLTPTEARKALCDHFLSKGILVELSSVARSTDSLDAKQIVFTETYDKEFNDASVNGGEVKVAPTPVNGGEVKVTPASVNGGEVKVAPVNTQLKDDTKAIEEPIRLGELQGTGSTLVAEWKEEQVEKIPDPQRWIWSSAQVTSLVQRANWSIVVNEIEVQGISTIMLHSWDGFRCLQPFESPMFYTGIGSIGFHSNGISTVTYTISNPSESSLDVRQPAYDRAVLDAVPAAPTIAASSTVPVTEDVSATAPVVPTAALPVGEVTSPKVAVVTLTPVISSSPNEIPKEIPVSPVTLSSAGVSPVSSSTPNGLSASVVSDTTPIVPVTIVPSVSSHPQLAVPYQDSVKIGDFLFPKLKHSQCSLSRIHPFKDGSSVMAICRIKSQFYPATVLKTLEETVDGSTV